MKIRTRILMILGATFIILFAFTFIATEQIIGNSYGRLEDREVVNNVGRATAALNININRLAITANDWGHWGDTYNFLIGELDDYPTINLETSSIANLQLNMMLFYNNSGKLYHATGVDIYSYEEKDIPPALIEYLDTQEFLFSRPGHPVYMSGILNTPEGPLLIAVNPITPSTDETTIAGTYIVARYLDTALIEELEETTLLSLNTWSLNTGDVTSDAAKLSSVLEADDNLYIHSENETSIIGTTLLNDISGNPVLGLDVEMPRHIYNQGKYAIHYLLTAFLLVAIICGIVLKVLLDRSLLDRFSLLTSNLKQITDNGSLSSRVKISGGDELNNLADNINHMLGALEKNEIEFQQAERENKKRMETVISSIICGTLIIDAETHIIVDVNPTAFELIGLPKEQILGNVDSDFICPVHKEDCLSPLFESIVNKSESILVNADGREIPVLISIVNVSLLNKSYLVASFVDMTRIREFEKALIDARITAEAANRAKSDFLATMSHELRTPLNSIIGFSDMMLDGFVGDPDKQKKYVGNISTSGKHLLSLINNILDLSKIEAGKMDMHCEMFSAYTTIDEVKQLISPLADEKGIKLEFNKDEGLDKIYADRLRFKQILFNLTSNAIKFTHPGGKVSISATKALDKTRFSVEDTGIGISEEDKSKLFQSFIQLDSATTRKHEGTGLGLSLVKRFVEMQNGRIWVESELGKGTKFTFELPLGTISDKKTGIKQEISAPVERIQQVIETSTQSHQTLDNTLQGK